MTVDNRYDGRGYDPPFPTLAEDNAMLVKDNQDLRERLAAAEAAAPCGHANRFTEWEDHSKPISCVKCRLAEAEARVTELTEQLELRVDVIRDTREAAIHFYGVTKDIFDKNVARGWLSMYPWLEPIPDEAAKGGRDE